MALFTISPQFTGNKLPSSSILSPLVTAGYSGQPGGKGASSSGGDSDKYKTKMLYRQGLEWTTAMRNAESELNETRKNVAMTAMNSNDPIGYLSKGQGYQDLKNANMKFYNTQNKYMAIKDTLETNKKNYDKITDKITAGELNENDLYFDGAFEYKKVYKEDGTEIELPITVGEKLSEWENVSIGKNIRGYSKPKIEKLYTAFDDAFKGLDITDEEKNTYFTGKVGMLEAPGYKQAWDIANTYSTTRKKPNVAKISAAIGEFWNKVQNNPELGRAYGYVSGLAKENAKLSGTKYKEADFQNTFINQVAGKYLVESVDTEANQVRLGKSTGFGYGRDINDMDIHEAIAAGVVMPENTNVSILKPGKGGAPVNQTLSNYNQYNYFGERDARINDVALSQVGTPNGIKLDNPMFGGFAYTPEGIINNLDDLKGLGIYYGGTVGVITDRPAPAVRNISAGEGLTNKEYYFLDPGIRDGIQRRNRLEAKQNKGNKLTKEESNELSALRVEIEKELLRVSDQMEQNFSGRLTHEQRLEKERWYQINAPRETVRTQRMVFYVPYDDSMWSTGTEDKVNRRLKYFNGEDISYGNWLENAETYTINDKKYKALILDVPVSTNMQDQLARKFNPDHSINQFMYEREKEQGKENYVGGTKQPVQ